jgi:biopolymer transport protein ExbD
MALPIHGASRITSAINVTPMVDVMLGLLTEPRERGALRRPE